MRKYFEIYSKSENKNWMPFFIDFLATVESSFIILHSATIANTFACRISNDVLHGSSIAWWWIGID